MSKKKVYKGWTTKSRAGHVIGAGLPMFGADAGKMMYVCKDGFHFKKPHKSVEDLEGVKIKRVTVTVEIE